jgi:hypothetical protein
MRKMTALGEMRFITGKRRGCSEHPLARGQWLHHWPIQQVEERQGHAKVLRICKSRDESFKPSYSMIRHVVCQIKTKALRCQNLKKKI